MAILIKATAEKKITISGTGIELPEVYGRIKFLGDFPGNTIGCEVATFANEETFTEGKILHTDVPIGAFNVNLEPGEVQSLEVAHKYTKIAYEQQGYNVEIII